MAAGCPVAASDLPYARDVAGDAAVYFDPGDPRCIADVVNDVLDSAERREGLLQAGRDRCRRYAYPAVAEDLASVLEEAVVAGGARG